MSVKAGDFAYYWIQPINLSRKPGAISLPMPLDVVLPGDAPWMPETGFGQSGDPLLTTDAASFDYAQGVDTLSDNLQSPFFLVNGVYPLNSSPTLTDRPFLRYADSSPTGGTLDNARDVWVAVAAFASDNTSSPMSNIVKVTVAGTLGSHLGSITLHVDFWPASPAGYKVFAAYDDPRLLTRIQLVTTGSPPATITVSSIGGIDEQPPSQYRTGLVARARRAGHLGIFGGAIESTGTNEIVVPDLVGSSTTWTGRFLQIIGQQFQSTPGTIYNYEITGFDSTLGKLLVTPDPSGASITPGDILVILAQSDGTATANTINDPGFMNSAYPGGNTNDESGLSVRILYGTGAGQERGIISNTPTGYTIDPPWQTVPDATSIFVIVQPGWEYFSDVLNYTCSKSGSPVVIKIPLPNLNDQQYIIGVFSQAQIGTAKYETDPAIIPVRLAWVFGNPSPLPNENIRELTATADPTNFTISADDQWVEIDTTLGNVVLTLPPTSDVTHSITFIKTSADANTVAFVPDSSDTLPPIHPVLTTLGEMWVFVVPKRPVRIPRRLF